MLYHDVLLLNINMSLGGPTTSARPFSLTPDRFDRSVTPGRVTVTTCRGDAGNSGGAMSGQNIKYALWSERHSHIHYHS